MYNEGPTKCFPNIKKQHLQICYRLSPCLSSPKESHGFTLIETVVVITTIAILLAIALPAFFGTKEAAADRIVRYSMIKAYKECKINIIRGDQAPGYTIMIDLHRTNGYYKFYQQYDYIPRKDGYIPPTKIGNCIGPLGPNRIGVRKINGNNIGGELWLNLDTAEKKEDGGLKWND
jgi:prepilin-type N-terminal cleavage/methylation domain-containing protein